MHHHRGRPGGAGASGGHGSGTRTGNPRHEPQVPARQAPALPEGDRRGLAQRRSGAGSAAGSDRLQPGRRQQRRPRQEQLAATAAGRVLLTRAGVRRRHARPPPNLRQHLRDGRQRSARHDHPDRGGPAGRGHVLAPDGTARTPRRHTLSTLEAALQDIDRELHPGVQDSAWTTVGSRTRDLLATSD